MNKVYITSDCTCDLSEELLNKYDVEVIHFYISTDRGCFKDRVEMTATNVVEYFGEIRTGQVTFWKQTFEWN